MFDSVLDRGNTPKSRMGAGTVLSVVLHVGLVALAVWLGSMPPAEKEAEKEVTFFAAPPPPPPPPPPAGGGAKKKEVKPKVEKKPTVRKDTIVQPKEIPQEKPAEAEPESDSEEEVEGGVEGGVVGGVAGGVVGGVIGGVIGGVVGGTGTGTDVLPFGAGMTRPEAVNKEACQPAYTREARAAQVQGMMIVKCRITTEGRLENCRVIKPLPFLAEEAVKALTSPNCRYTPVTFQGRPVAVDYTFNLRMKLQ